MIKNKIIILIIASLTFSTFVYSDTEDYMPNNDLYKGPHLNYVEGTAVVSRIYEVSDGATFRCELKGLPKIIGHRIDVSVFGIKPPKNTKENFKTKMVKGDYLINSTIKKYHIDSPKESMEAEKFLLNVLKQANVIELRKMRRSAKDFRIIAKVYVDGKSVEDLIDKAGFNLKYDSKPLKKIKRKRMFKLPSISGSLNPN